MGEKKTADPHRGAGRREGGVLTIPIRKKKKAGVELKKKKRSENGGPSPVTVEPGKAWFSFCKGGRKGGGRQEKRKRRNGRFAFAGFTG